MVLLDVCNEQLLHLGDVLADLALVRALGRELLPAVAELRVPLLLGLLRQPGLLLHAAPGVVPVVVLAAPEVLIVARLLLDHAPGAGEGDVGVGEGLLLGGDVYLGQHQPELAGLVVQGRAELSPAASIKLPLEVVPVLLGPAPDELRGDAE